MINKPSIKKFLDDEEKAVVEAIEHKGYKVGKNALTPTRLKELTAAARATINEERVKISLRLQKSDLERLKAKALREGMPYQTLINSILHKAVTN
jgi:predicted DNA binding CopG/RHH family protein